MPTRPNRIDDWGAPALSTRKIRVFSTGGALGILTAGIGLGFHPMSVHRSRESSAVRFGAKPRHRISEGQATNDLRTRPIGAFCVEKTCLVCRVALIAS